MAADITPFRIEVGEQQLADLRERLARTRWPEPEPVSDWSQGIPLAYLQELCEHWRERYDWRRTEAALNEYEQFTTELDGLPIHFLHVRSPHEGALPLVITHGWPGSIIEFSKVIGPLTDPPAYGGDAADAFHLVCPSLPGYGFSGKPDATGWSVQRIASAWAQLMDRLGYSRYGAQGGDWGSSVTMALAGVDADHLAGIHVNMATADPKALGGLGELNEQEQAAMASLAHYMKWDSGYSTEQATRPQTVGYGLVDSPAGMCGWIVEKFWSWTDCDGHPENVFTRDELLDNVMLYWLPAAGASSARLYWESFRARDFEQIDVPSGISVFPKEIFRLSRRWAETRFTDLRHFGEPPRGGHFASMEQPQLFLDEVRAFFASVR
ncbi:MAG TPA: epoxide hydrolase [Solirubrobacteraceae bacterium]|nr:epoxide hydrolase [Solirubrobacteraceae bacterium]